MTDLSVSGTTRMLRAAYFPSPPTTSSTQPNSEVDLDPDTTDQFTKREKFVEEVLNLWWDIWFREVFDSLFPLPKWKERLPNLEVDNICILRYEGKI